MPTAETQDDLHELLRAANFLTLSELVHTVVARVAVSMEPVRSAHLTCQLRLLTPRGRRKRRCRGCCWRRRARWASSTRR